MSDTIYIYGLTDPRDHSVKYVGQTSDVERRHQQHCRGKGGTPRAQWVRELHREGLSPGVVVLDSAPSRGDAYDCENWWILYQRTRSEQIVNATWPGMHRANFDGILDRAESDRAEKRHDIGMGIISGLAAFYFLVASIAQWSVSFTPWWLPIFAVLFAPTVFFTLYGLLVFVPFYRFPAPEDVNPWSVAAAGYHWVKAMDRSERIRFWFLIKFAVVYPVLFAIMARGGALQ